jgi:thiamine biosynthesis lipoprotein
MGTDVHVVVHGPAELGGLAHELVDDLERRWSRFLPGSEVSRLNRQAGSWTSVGADTIELVDRAVEAWTATDGRYDPTVLGDVIRAGYDRSFEHVVDRPDSPSSDLACDAGHIAVDHEQQAIRLPIGVGFDPGGIGKGLAADLVARRISDEGAAGVLVNVGGDLRAQGVGPDGDDWTVEVDPAATGLPVATVAIGHGALATSTVLRRRWRIDGRPRHHVIDPATGDPTDSGVVASSVLAREGWQAEVLAKATIVAGIDQGLALVGSLGADAVLVDEVGDVHTTPGFGRFAVAARS